MQLLARQAAAKDGGADVTEARLALRMDTDVIAEDVVGKQFRDAGEEGEVEPRLKFGEEAFGGPPFFHEEIFEAGAFAAFAQALLIAEDLGDCANSAKGLMRQEEGVETNGQMRFVGEAAADA